MYALKKKNDNHENKAYEKQEIVELTWYYKAKKTLNDIMCRKQLVWIKTEGHF